MRNIEMKQDVLWREWREIIQFEFEHKLEASGINMGPASQGISAILLLTKSIGASEADILRETIRIIKGRDTNNADQPGCSPQDTQQLDDIAMMGHRIGMVENLSDLNQFLQNIHRVLKLDEQVMLTSIDLQRVARNNRSAEYKEFNNVKLPNGNLLGPYFCMVRFNAEAIKYQAAKTGWQFQIVYQNDERNYLVLLSGSE